MCRIIRNNISPRNDSIKGSKDKSWEEVKKKEEQKIYFTFEDFRFKPINIEKVFNNHFKDENDYISKTLLLLMESLPMFSNEVVKDLIGDRAKNKKLHFHPLEQKYEIIENILKEYGFSEKRIENIIQGKRLYQMALQTQRSSTRLVVEKLGNIFSILFIDSNHHIYLNNKITKNERTLFYEYCPNHISEHCDFMKNMDECFAFDYLDHNKLKESFGYEYMLKNDDEE